MVEIHTIESVQVMKSFCTNCGRWQFGLDTIRYISLFIAWEREKTNKQKQEQREREQQQKTMNNCIAADTQRNTTIVCYLAYSHIQTTTATKPKKITYIRDTHSHKLQTINEDIKCEHAKNNNTSTETENMTNIWSLP